MTGNPRGFFVIHMDVCCDFPVREMNEYHRTLGNSADSFVILGTEVRGGGVMLSKGRSLDLHESVLALSVTLCGYISFKNWWFLYCNY